jgi:hypothetical protein
MTSMSIIHMDLHNHTTSWLVHSWNIFVTHMNYGHTRIHKIHHNLNLEEAITFPLITFYVIRHGLHPNVIFPRTHKLGVTKFMKLRFSPFWRPITSCVDFQLKRGLKQSCSLGKKKFKNMWYITYMHIIQGDSQLLMVRNQIDVLIPNLFLGHNLCCKYSNGSCEIILNIYISRSFQWYKKLFNSINFDP